MAKRTFLVTVVIILLIVGVGFTTIESNSMQADMSNFENQLTTDGVTSVINNSSALGDIAIKIQEIIDLLLSTVLSFFQKIIGMFH